MGESQKNSTTPSCEVRAPQSIIPLMQAFHVDSEEAANALILSAGKAIFGNEDSFNGSKITEEELEVVSSLIKGITPADSIESLYAAQIVSSHWLGLRKLASDYSEDQKLGLKLLRFSNEAMQSLEKKRGGGRQNISVTYSQTLIKES